MTFREAPTDEKFDLLHLVSEGGKWELGWLKMLFGVRVRLGQVGSFYVHLDLCCGAEPWLRLLVLGYVMGKLSGVPEEELTAKMIRELFPHPEVKPLSRDPVWCELLHLKPPEDQFSASDKNQNEKP